MTTRLTRPKPTSEPTTPTAPQTPGFVRMLPIGATVQLRSGGHLMTVVGHDVEERTIGVIWSSYEGLQRSTVPADSLRPHDDYVEEPAVVRPLGDPFAPLR